MTFTREDILKIQNALLQLGRKDSEFKDANTPLNSDDYIAILQDGINKKVSINNLLSTLGLLKKDDFINVSDRYDEYYILLSEAITIIANNKRKKGLVITFLDIDGNWRIYLFIGELSNFIITDYWKDLHDFKYPIINTVLPDEEDLTLTYPNIEGNSFIKLKDKEYNLDNFSGLGKVILRKNIVEVEDPTYGKIKKNILYQDMINKSNTIYIIQYDFTLGENITIPENCILKFDGGILKNGTIIGNKTNICTTSYEIFNNVILDGTWVECGARLSWFVLKKDISKEWISLLKCFSDIYIDKNGTISEGFIVSDRNYLKLRGNGSVITITGSPNINGETSVLSINNISYVDIRGIVFDFANEVLNGNIDSTTKIIHIDQYCSLVCISNLIFSNYGKKEANQNKSGLVCIHTQSVSESVSLISNITFKNMYVCGDSYIDTEGKEHQNTDTEYGTLYGIKITGNTIDKKPGKCIISGCSFDNFTTILTDGRICADDGGGIYIYCYPTSDFGETNYIIRDCYFHNVGKRCIKMQAKKCLIKNIYLNWDEENRGYYAALDIMNSDAIIDGIYGKYPGTIIRCINDTYIKHMNVSGIESYPVISASEDAKSMIVCEAKNIVKHIIIEDSNITSYIMMLYGNDANEKYDKESTIKFINCTLNFVNTGIYSPLRQIFYINCVLNLVPNHTIGAYVEIKNSIIYNFHGKLSNAYKVLSISDSKLYYTQNVYGYTFGASTLNMNNLYITSENNEKISIGATIILSSGNAIIDNVIFNNIITGGFTADENSNVRLSNIEYSNQVTININVEGVTAYLDNIRNISYINSEALSESEVNVTSKVTSVRCLINNTNPIDHCYNTITKDSDILYGSLSFLPSKWTIKEAGTKYIDTENKRVVIWNGKSWTDDKGNPVGTLYSGTTEQRPTSVDNGFLYFDTTLKKPIWKADTEWVDATGANV